jgi:hypothetical protein
MGWLVTAVHDEGDGLTLFEQLSSGYDWALSSSYLHNVVKISLQFHMNIMKRDKFICPYCFSKCQGN